MDSEAVERLIDIVLQMQINLAHVTQTLQQQTYEMRQQLQLIFENQRKALDDCIVRMDEKLSECSVCVENYRRGYSSLETMRYKLVQLGADPAPMPAALQPTESILSSSGA